MTASLLRTESLFKRFGGIVATDNVSLDVLAGETHAIIGPNGSGKTTLVAQLQGELTSDSGAVHFDGQDITRASVAERALVGVVRSYQISSVFPYFTALANVAIAVQARSGTSFRFWRNAVRDRSLLGPARDALEAIGLGARADVLASELSHGERRQLELAMVLALRPKLLLLDEPMAGMGRQDSLRVTKILEKLKSDYTIVLVEHDMNAVFALADRITVLVNGRQVACGLPGEIQSNPVVKAAYLGHKSAGRVT